MFLPLVQLKQRDHWHFCSNMVFWSSLSLDFPLLIAQISFLSWPLLRSFWTCNNFMWCARKKKMIPINLSVLLPSAISNKLSLILFISIVCHSYIKYEMYFNSIPNESKPQKIFEISIERKNLDKFLANTNFHNSTQE